MFFSVKIVVYLFLGGVAGGLLLCSCIWSMRFHRMTAHPSSRFETAFGVFFTRCTAVGALALTMSLLCLLWDLGRPDRAFQLFLTLTPTVLTLGALSLGADLVLAVILSAVSAGMLTVSRIARRALEMACAATSLVVITYTGIYLYNLNSVAFWHSPAIVAVFLFSSLSTGISAMLLVAYFAGDRARILGAVKPLQNMHIAIILSETASIIWFLWAASANSSASSSLELLVSEDVLPLAILGVAMLALAIPLVLESHSVARRSYRDIPASDTLCLVGGFMLRYCIVLCGLH
ncbi:MAG: polysulfide reductase NrfD [Coriobacteriaceae bacterium]|nr:polysulfide reductase NrfD [Coriobacteriaceae bacterium]